MSESSIQMNVIGTLQQKGQNNSQDVCLCNHKATLMMMKEKTRGHVAPSASSRGMWRSIKKAVLINSITVLIRTKEINGHKLPFGVL